MNATERQELLISTFGAVHAFGGDGKVGDLFLIAPNRLGFGVRANPIPSADPSVGTKIAMLFNIGLPPGSMVQFCSYTSPNIRALLDRYASGRVQARSELLRTLVRDRIAFLEAATRRTIDTRSNILVRDTQLLITVSIPFKGSTPTDDDFARATELRAAFLQTISSAGIPSIGLDGKTYIRWMECLLNTDEAAVWRHAPYPRHDKERLICEQLLDPGESVEYDSEGVWLSGSTRVRILSPKNYPATANFGRALTYLVDDATGTRGIRDPALITLNVLVQDQEAVSSKLDKKSAWATQQLGTGLGRWVQTIPLVDKELRQIRAHKEQGAQLVRCYLQMAVLTHGKGRTKEAREETDRLSAAAVVNARSYWSEFGFQLAPERNNLPLMFSQMLPFAGDAEAEQWLSRYRTMTADIATCLAPALGAWRGSETPLLTLLARDGQIMAYSPWDNVAPHGLIIAATGSGKSFLAQEMIVNKAACGERQFVIDIGRSYKNLSSLLDGQFIEFGRESNICVNPFSLVTDYEEDADALFGIVGAMASEGGRLSDFQKAGLRRVMRETFDLHGTNTTVREVAERLSASADSRLSDLGAQLYPFAHGEYARYFAGQHNVDPASPFVVLELDDIKSRHMARVVLLSLIYQIQQAVYGSRERNVRTSLLIDEAYLLLTEGDAGETENPVAIFLDHAYRRFRKYGASIFMISQDFASIYESPIGGAVKANCHTTFLLGQSSASIEEARDRKYLGSDAWVYEAAKTLTTVRGSYSEIMVISEAAGAGIGRLYVSPFTQLVYSTTPDEVSAIEQRRRAGMSLVDAINDLLEARSRRSAA